MSTDVVSSGAGRIGRYFSVVSALPATVFVSYLYLLFRTGAPTEPVDWSKATDFDPAGLAALGIGALVLALALNPLQFPLIQLFEGYWGSSRLAVELALIRTIHHRQRRRTLIRRHGKARPGLTGRDPRRRYSASPDEIRAGMTADEIQRELAAYPEPDLGRELPTRLGNVLRRYEDAIARPYGLDPLVTVPRLVMVAGQPEIDYVQNQRVQMELALRTSFLALLATLVTVVVMSSNGAWLLLAAAPYSVAYLSYRGAVALAHEYGMSLAVLTDLGRFALYERLHLPHPPNTLAERQLNRSLMELFRMNDSAWLTYERPESPAAGTPAPPSDRTPPDAPE
ncbi:hypothetical protein [Actinoplanes palleronii]|uniref:DUF4239 domain-containing protein n=1 Tax=Actinoplanes palleronii TaxID=113570 RepID=A0ABQ4BI96_9ACTN|nr:hypothetical protein [Actinoplanes palleronii]GIE70317.1 hypothetical protein Apa02nite_064250 [Actinoplanes palleronii]